MVVVPGCVACNETTILKRRMDMLRLVFEIDTLDAEGGLKSLSVRKTYYINVIFQLKHDEQTKYQHFRIVMSRDGVIEINEI